MNTVFIPAIRVMNHLRYPQKFLLIGILLLLPLLLLLSQYISATNAVIDFASKERLGLVYTGPLVKLYNDLLRQWSGQGEVGSTAENANPLQTISADVDQVNAVDAQLGVTLSVHSQWLALQSQAQTASANADRDVRYAALSRALRLLIIQVGNNSNLILDSDIDTYYLMDNLINKLPELADQVTTISTSAGTRILGQSDRARLTILSSMARFSLESSQRSYNYALNYNPALNTQLQAGVSSYVQTISAALDRIDSFNTLLANRAALSANWL